MDSALFRKGNAGILIFLTRIPAGAVMKGIDLDRPWHSSMVNLSAWRRYTLRNESESASRNVQVLIATQGAREGKKEKGKGRKGSGGCSLGK